MNTGTKTIQRLHLSDIDRYHLDRQANRAVAQELQPDDYHNRVVLKPWGYEFLLFENSSVAVWFLSIRPDHATSMHCHPHKKTALLLLSGKAFSSTFQKRQFLLPGEALMIEKGVFHATRAYSNQGIDLIEVETPPNKLDLCRLEDQYGRLTCGYEGYAQMVTQELSAFHYHRFAEDDHDSHLFTTDGKYAIRMATFASADDFSSQFKIDPGALYCLCTGSLRAGSGMPVCGVGDIESGIRLAQCHGLQSDGPVVLMIFNIFG
ncbi:MAG: hypothetical protein HQL60_07400 [Magnetococcales bacterium]|nr:hypothetical protein [Magnetococcales bacterium]